MNVETQALSSVLANEEIDIGRFLRIERFLYLEASLMDAHEYDAWLALWEGDQLCYWVPCNNDNQDPATGLGIIYDSNRDQLEDRIARLKDKTAHAFRPCAKLTRVVSNVVLLATSGDEVEVASSFVLSDLRRGVANLWLGKSIHKLRETRSGLRILGKKVMLLNNDEPMPNLTFLV